jgi:hypothetical protein
MAAGMAYADIRAAMASDHSPFPFPEPAGMPGPVLADGRQVPLHEQVCNHHATGMLEIA